MSEAADNPGAAFDAERSRLVGIAHRMLGSKAEAEDVVQDAYVRWHRADRDAVRNPPAFLTRIVTRLCLDVLKSARVRRETYVGTWLPEPAVGPRAGVGHDVTVALMMALERLSPLERAAFLLHDVFGVGYDEIARTLERSREACRQLASRARDHVREARPRFPVDDERGREIADAFFAAARQGDIDALEEVLADDVVLYADGGGKVPAVREPVHGGAKIARFFAALAEGAGDRDWSVLYRGTVDGLPGFVIRDPDGLLQTMALAIDDDRIQAIYVVRNPDKLVRLRIPSRDDGRGRPGDRDPELHPLDPAG